MTPKPITFIMILLVLSRIEVYTTSVYEIEDYDNRCLFVEKRCNFEFLIYCPYAIYRYLPYIPIATKDDVLEKKDKLKEKDEICIEYKNRNLQKLNHYRV